MTPYMLNIGLPKNGKKIKVLPSPAALYRLEIYRALHRMVGFEAPVIGVTGASLIHSLLARFHQL